ncbi:FecR family protein, partial [Sphingomonas adhaesiva]
MRRALAAVLAASCSTQALAGPAGWTISEASGPVTIARGGVSTVATRGGAVGAGDVVSTGRGGRAVLVRGTEFMMVAPGSRLRLPAEAQPAGVTRVIEELGNVVFMIKKKMTPHFEVKTPYLAAVVKGTTFSVGVSGAGTSVQVLEGAVDVATLDGGAHDLVTPGAVAMVAAGNRMRMTIEESGRTRVIESPGAGEGEPAAPAAPVAVEQTAGED